MLSYVLKSDGKIKPSDFKSWIPNTDQTGFGLQIRKREHDSKYGECASAHSFFLVL